MFSCDSYAPLNQIHVDPACRTLRPRWCKSCEAPPCSCTWICIDPCAPGVSWSFHVLQECSAVRSQGPPYTLHALRPTAVPRPLPAHCAAVQSQQPCEMGFATQLVVLQLRASFTSDDAFLELFEQLTSLECLDISGGPWWGGGSARRSEGAPGPCCRWRLSGALKLHSRTPFPLQQAATSQTMASAASPGWPAASRPSSWGVGME